MDLETLTKQISDAAVERFRAHLHDAMNRVVRLATEVYSVDAQPFVSQLRAIEVAIVDSGRAQITKQALEHFASVAIEKLDDELKRRETESNLL